MQAVGLADADHDATLPPRVAAHREAVERREDVCSAPVRWWPQS